MLVKSLAMVQRAEHTEQKSEFILGYVIFGLDVHLCTSSVVSADTPQLSSLAIHESGRAERSDRPLTSTAMQLLPGSLVQVSVNLSGFINCLIPWDKDAPWVLLVCLLRMCKEMQLYQFGVL